MSTGTAILIGVFCYWVFGTVYMTLYVPSSFSFDKERPTLLEFMGNATLWWVIGPLLAFCSWAHNIELPFKRRDRVHRQVCGA